MARPLMTTVIKPDLATDGMAIKIIIQSTNRAEAQPWSFLQFDGYITHLRLIIKWLLSHLPKLINFLLIGVVLYKSRYYLDPFPRTRNSCPANQPVLLLIYLFIFQLFLQVHNMSTIIARRHSNNLYLFLTFIK